MTARDPITMACAAGSIVLTTLVAGYLPVRRASRIEPVTVLRSE